MGSNEQMQKMESSKFRSLGVFFLIVIRYESIIKNEVR